MMLLPASLLHPPPFFFLDHKHQHSISNPSLSPLFFLSQNIIMYVYVFVDVPLTTNNNITSGAPARQGSARGRDPAGGRMGGVVVSLLQNDACIIHADIPPPFSC